MEFTENATGKTDQTISETNENLSDIAINHIADAAFMDSVTDVEQDDLISTTTATTVVIGFNIEFYIVAKYEKDKDVEFTGFNTEIEAKASILSQRRSDSKYSWSKNNQTSYRLFAVTGVNEIQF